MVQIMLSTQSSKASNTLPVFLMDNNSVLKKIKVAHKFEVNDIRAIMMLAGRETTKSEVSGYLYGIDNRKFQSCPDVALEAFLDGLIKFYRKDLDEGSPS
jgi:uncharacterized protein YehS (DUF1456 family)